MLQARRWFIEGGALFSACGGFLERLESSITRSILAKLNKIPGCKAKKFVSGPMSQDLDIYGSYQGRAFFLEVKRPRLGVTSNRQAHLIDAWQAVGAISGVVTSAAEAVRLVTQNALPSD